MSRMLEALKQIEDRVPPGEESVATLGPLESPQPVQTTESPEILAQETIIKAPAAKQTPGLDQHESSRNTTTAAACRKRSEQQETPALEQSTPAGRRPEMSPSPPPRSHQQCHVRLADSILSQLPQDGKAVLLFAAASGDELGHGQLLPLGTALAEQIAGETLVIDGNLRCPTLAEEFSIHSELGLADVLREALTWQEAVCRTDVKGLSVLPGAKVQGDDVPPRQFEPKVLLEELRRRYQLVLIEGAAPTDPETASLARLCDGTYVIIRLGHTPRRVARRAIHDLQDSGGQVLGCVLIDG